MKPSDLTRLLNATPLGPVINLKRLYRHRIQAGGLVGTGKRVDLFGYTAWLLHERRARGQSQARLSGPVNTRNVLRLLDRQRYCCALTGRTLAPDNCALDHILPVCHGGAHRIENAQALHRDVNRAKGTMTNEDFIQLCREVVAYAHRHIEPVRP